MKKSFKYKISKTLAGNNELNKKALIIKKSWDEVEELLRANSKNKKK